MGTVVDGAPVRSTHLQVGFGDNLVVNTFSVRESEKESVNAKEFFEHEMEKIVSSLRVTGA
jgi:hypothetical protein